MQKTEGKKQLSTFFSPRWAANIFLHVLLVASSAFLTEVSSRSFIVWAICARCFTNRVLPVYWTSNTNKKWEIVKPKVMCETKQSSLFKAYDVKKILYRSSFTNHSLLLFPFLSVHKFTIYFIKHNLKWALLFWSQYMK